MKPVKKSQAAFSFIIVTTFLSVMGIGVIIPVIPFIVAKYVGASNTNKVAFYVGLLISLYAFCQFFAAPVLGALSDKYGRRPILLICQFGSAIGYLMFGIGGALWVLFLGRIIDGLTGGDISTIFAYIADSTEPHERGKKFGIIGATVGFGFMLGPTIGGLLSNISLSAPLFAAAAITFLNMLFGYFILPESLDKEHRNSDFTLHHLNPFLQLQFAFSKPNLKQLFLIGSFYFLAFAQLQGISSVFYKDTMGFTPTSIGMIFLLVGVLDIFTQGYLSGKLMPQLGEKRMVELGFLLTGAGYLLYSVIPSFPLLVVVIISVIIYAVGSGFFEPAYGAIISKSAEPREQGRIQGASQSMQSVSRILGPILAAGLYQFGVSNPYIFSFILSIAGFIAINRLQKSVSKE